MFYGYWCTDRKGLWPVVSASKASLVHYTTLHYTAPLLTSHWVTTTTAESWVECVHQKYTSSMTNDALYYHSPLIKSISVMRGAYFKKKRPNALGLWGPNLCSADNQSNSCLWALTAGSLTGLHDYRIHPHSNKTNKREKCMITKKF